MGFTLFLTQQFKMTKENREKLYKHMRHLEKNYEARDELNSGLTATSALRKRAKESADAILAKHPELEAPVEAIPDNPAKTEAPEQKEDFPEENIELPPEERKPKTKSKVKE